MQESPSGAVYEISIQAGMTQFEVFQLPIHIKQLNIQKSYIIL